MPAMIEALEARPQTDEQEVFEIVRANEEAFRAILRDAKAKLDGFFPPDFNPDAPIQTFFTEGAFGVDYFQVGQRIQGKGKLDKEAGLGSSGLTPTQVLIQIRNSASIKGHHFVLQYDVAKRDVEFIAGAEANPPTSPQ